MRFNSIREEISYLIRARSKGKARMAATELPPELITSLLLYLPLLPDIESVVTLLGSEGSQHARGRSEPGALSGVRSSQVHHRTIHRGRCGSRDDGLTPAPSRACIVIPSW